MGVLTDFMSSEENFSGTPLGHIFKEVPVSLDEFLYSGEYVQFPATPGLSEVQYDVLRHAERVYPSYIYPLMAEEFGGYWKEVEDVRMVNILNVQWGKGGGKDAVIRLAVLRIVYLLLCLRSPQGIFGFPPSASIHILNVAASSGQAFRSFFEPMTRDVKTGWFSERATPRKASIMFDNNIEAVSGHSNTENLEGMSCIAAIFDECDAVKSRNEMVGLGKRSRESSTSAESILNMLRTSSSTRFPETYKQMTISFPRYAGSMIQKLTDEAKEHNAKYGRESNLYHSGPYATWEANPLRKKEDFAQDYLRDPIEAAAKYECKPARSSSPYFRDMEIFKDSIDRQEPAVKVDYELKKVVSEDTGIETEQWEPVYTFADWFKPVPGARYAMHGDLAIVGDRAGVAMSHVVDWIEKDVTKIMDDGSFEIVTENMPIIRNDFTIAFESDIGLKPAREIKVRWARELAFELIKRGWLVTRYTFDQFQSRDSMQILESAGIESERVSTDVNNSVWRTLKDIASDGRLRMENNELLMTEIESLIDLGRKVDHPPSGSKDLADAFGCSIVGAIEVGGSEDESYEEVQYGDSIFDYSPPGGILAQNMPLGVSLVGSVPIGMTLEGPIGG